MADNFSTAIGILFGGKFLTETTSKADFYIYDDDNQHRTFITDIPHNALHIHNLNKLTISHIPIDGGIIEWGRANYIPNTTGSNGRPDCMVFNEFDLYYAELKTNATSSLLGNKNALKGMHQIEDFVVYLQSIKSIPFTQRQHSVVCIDKKLIKYNVAFLNETEKFRQKTGMKIQFDEEITFDNR